MSSSHLTSRLVIGAVVAAFVVAVAGVRDLLVGQPLLSEPLVVVGVAIGFVIAAIGPSVQSAVRRS